MGMRTDPKVFRELGAKDRESLRQRLLRLIQKGRGRNPCWIWVGATSYRKNGPKYGYLVVKGKKMVARRLVYYLWKVLPQPLGDFTVSTSCGNPLCVNPDHLVRGDKLKSPGPMPRV